MTPRAALTRRTALATAVLAPAGLAACDIDPPAGPSPTTAAVPTPDEDVVLVGSLVSAIAEAQAVVTAAGGAVPALGRVLDALLAAHSAHRALLVDAAPDTSPAATPSPGPGGRPLAAVDAVRRVERRLLARVERACVQAASGDLARVLAVMAGSLAQHAAALDAAGPAPFASAEGVR